MMTGTGVITTAMLIAGAAATVGVANNQGWVAFGDFDRNGAAVDSCKTPLITIGWSTGSGARQMAETKALIKWQDKARGHGKKYSYWHNASNRHVRCKIFAGVGAKCIIKGQPCEDKVAIDFDKLF